MTATVTDLWPGARLVSADTGVILPDGPPRPALPARVELRPAARLDVEETRRFLMELDDRMCAASPARVAYLMGLLEGHARNLLDLIDTIARA
jgi:hypothetical protein